MVKRSIDSVSSPRKENIVFPHHPPLVQVKHFVASHNSESLKSKWSWNEVDEKKKNTCNIIVQDDVTCIFLGCFLDRLHFVIVLIVVLPRDRCGLTGKIEERQKRVFGHSVCWGLTFLHTEVLNTSIITFIIITIIIITITFIITIIKHGSLKHLNWSNHHQTLRSKTTSSPSPLSPSTSSESGVSTLRRFPLNTICCKKQGLYRI